MDIVDQINISLDENINLTIEVKNYILHLIKTFHSKLPNIGLEGFNIRAKTLKIEEGNKYICRDIVEYDFLKNVLFINGEKIKDEDGKNILMVGLLDVISSTGKYSGLKENNQFQALNIGVAEILATYLVGNGCESYE